MCVLAGDGKYIFYFFSYILEELSASLLAFVGHGTTEHHDLLLAGEFVEDGLDVSSLREGGRKEGKSFS
jgi:hypothetical protein